MKDAQIVELYWKRDEAAIAATAEVYGNYCYSIAYNILQCSEDAKECVNETFRQEKEDFTLENMAKIPCNGVLGTYKVEFER